MVGISPFLGEFDGVDDAWHGLVRAIEAAGSDVEGSIDPLSIGSAFGARPRAYREFLGASVVIRNPRNRLVYSKVRRVDYGYLLANVIWVAVGSDELARIAFYNPRGRDFSDDGMTLSAAIGKRIFRSSHGDQFSACAAILSRDHTSRRAVVSVFTPEDAGSLHRDCSCVLTLQFFQRNGDLHCIACMRSHSALMLFPYDAFLLTMLHESMAVEIGADLGTFVLQFGSLHYYHDEAELAALLLDETSRSLPAMPPMRISLATAAGALGQAEEEIRRTGRHSERSDIDAYWRTYLTALQHASEPDSKAPRTRDFPDCLASSWYASLQ